VKIGGKPASHRFSEKNDVTQVFLPPLFPLAQYEFERWSNLGSELRLPAFATAGRGILIGRPIVPAFSLRDCREREDGDSCRSCCNSCVFNTESNANCNDEDE
jgi:hypothetical protein